MSAITNIAIAVIQVFFAFVLAAIVYQILKGLVKSINNYLTKIQ